MCRPEKPITTNNSALRELQEWLRDQRNRTEQGYRALSVRAGCHATTLQRAASSQTVPKLQTVLNYARACDASPEEARRLWKRARYEETRRARGGRGLPAPRPEFIRDFVDLGAAVVDLYEKAGSPTLRTMEQRAGGYGVLPRSTAHRIKTKQTMPHSLSQFRAYLRACEVPEADWLQWEGAWTRAWRHEKQDDFAALGTFGTPGTEPWFAASQEVLREMEETTGATSKQYLQELQHRAHLYVNHGGPLHPTPVQVKHRDPVQPARKRGVRAHRYHLPERPVPGQLTFPIGEPTPEPDAVF
ncbi:helix-turn-helix domain-containing protein [Streptomyces sp. NPDC087317]|uniref:helix-turn-helix domain-containing protein n=1 Tax=Streptomyces sp. NPDC087317 TaxID=3365784 RepID=UPI0038106B23